MEARVNRKRNPSLILICAVLVLCAAPGVVGAQTAPSTIGLFEAHGDVGTVLHPGSAEYDTSTASYTISGSGANMWFATDAFLGFSMVLLRFSSLAAFGLFLALIGVAAYSIYAWLYLEVVPGWTSIMISIIIVSFFQLIALSVIGEYVGRIYMSTKHRPLFIIDAIERHLAK